MTGSAGAAPARDAGADSGAGVWFWARVVVAVLRRPGLWWTAVVQLHRLAPPGWWRRFPFVPVPDARYVAFRWSTAYGTGRSPRPDEVVAYLAWCRERPR